MDYKRNMNGMTGIYPPASTVAIEYSQWSFFCVRIICTWWIFFCHASLPKGISVNHGHFVKHVYRLDAWTNHRQGCAVAFVSKAATGPPPRI